MTERKKLKKQLSKLKAFKSHLPILIDCSNVYGDNYYTKDDFEDVNNQIKDIEDKISAIDLINTLK